MASHRVEAWAGIAKKLKENHMTKPGSTNQIQFPPENFALIQKVSGKLGLPANAVAPNARIVGRHEAENWGEKTTVRKECPAGPTFEIEEGVLKPFHGASMQGIRLGVSVHYSNGAAQRWTMVMRREGARICELDYADEETCETELEALRMCIDAFLVSDVLFSFPTQAIGIRNFDASSGVEL